MNDDRTQYASRSDQKVSSSRHNTMRNLQRVQVWKGVAAHSLSLSVPAPLGA